MRKILESVKTTIYIFVAIFVIDAKEIKLILNESL